MLRDSVVSRFMGSITALVELAALAFGLPAEAKAQPFSVEVLSLPYNSILGRDSRQSMSVGISADGTIITGNGFDIDAEPNGFPDTFRYHNSIAFQYNRTNGQFTYYPQVPQGGSYAFAQTVSRDGNAAFVTSGLVRDRFYVNGQGYIKPFTGVGEIYPSIANSGLMVIGETTSGPFVYRNGALATPPPPPGFSDYYPEAVSADASSFTTYEGLYYTFQTSTWYDLGDLTEPGTWADPFIISADGTTVVGSSGPAGSARSHFRWSVEDGFTYFSVPTSFTLEWDFGSSDLSILGRGSLVYSHSLGLIDMTQLVNASGAMPAGLTMDYFTGVADDQHTFVGIARDSVERQFSVVVTTVPAPGAAGLVAMGLAAASPRRRPRADGRSSVSGRRDA